MNTDNIKVAVF